MHSENRKGKPVKRARKVQRNDIYSLKELFDRLVRAKQAENVVQETIDKYMRACQYLSGYAEELGMSADIRHIDVDFARGFVSWLINDKVKFDGHKFKLDEHKTQGLSPRSVNDYIKTIRTFFRFLIDEDLATENPFLNLKLITEPDDVIEILTKSELKRLLAAPYLRSYPEFRDFVIITCLIDSLCRVGEILSLKVDNIDFSSNFLVLKGTNTKTRKGRLIPLQARTIRLLKELIKENEEFDTDYVFLTNYGEQMTTNNFRHRLNTYAQRAGIKKKVHPHLLRHTGATMFLEAGGDIRHLQMILGHNDLRMIKRYTHLSRKSLKEQHDKFSPLAQISSKAGYKRKTKNNTDKNCRKLP
ncbi:tyrosine-type recombinase/integrase [Bacillus inaquosorum]|uniref:tyrosine-type recombinase/integrase n=1 Tax=Bacillus inaquosorum TaxID=483913 RepID=UPI0022819961|nr:tyrosine-type recombinase/integrase [Bacillus inaquosorum]MCY7941090.1 tyrosine-type recombinase/integrase [Bacillus inaquosorum]